MTLTAKHLAKIQFEFVLSPVPVSRYQHEDSKRKIRRLEQCAQSSLQRAIASQGALAILYGRRLKYYIRETEVLTEILSYLEDQQRKLINRGN
ncbi:hypothetical protein RHGRI_026273 [Rhododendron griersonianum]|uniref:Uncharacterized protein n=1 Tax=Rhododendron griersonianum TaxID=479676 RepID=A0AAV6IVQ7_9ERIC|nr:hypothetical protein RHGRI_026273 [Rhododendron griersonianum]